MHRSLLTLMVAATAVVVCAGWPVEEPGFVGAPLTPARPGSRRQPRFFLFKSGLAALLKWTGLTGITSGLAGGATDTKAEEAAAGSDPVKDDASEYDISSLLDSLGLSDSYLSDADEEESVYAEPEEEVDPDSSKDDSHMDESDAKPLYALDKLAAHGQQTHIIQPIIIYKTLKEGEHEYATDYL